MVISFKYQPEAIQYSSLELLGIFDPSRSMTRRNFFIFMLSPNTISERTRSFAIITPTSICQTRSFSYWAQLPRIGHQTQLSSTTAPSPTIRGKKNSTTEIMQIFVRKYHRRTESRSNFPGIHPGRERLRSSNKNFN